MSAISEAATAAADTALRAAFAAALYAAMDEASRLGYHPKRLYGMLQTMTPVQAARQCVTSGATGFDSMVRIDRIELTIEALCLDPRYRSLFKDAELDCARWRLRQAGVTETHGEKL